MKPASASEVESRVLSKDVLCVFAVMLDMFSLYIMILILLHTDYRLYLEFDVCLVERWICTIWTICQGGQGAAPVALLGGVVRTLGSWNESQRVTMSHNRGSKTLKQSSMLSAISEH